MPCTSRCLSSMVSSFYSVLIQHLKSAVEIFLLMKYFLLSVRPLPQSVTSSRLARLVELKRCCSLWQLTQQVALVSNYHLMTIYCKLFNCLLLGVKQTENFRWQGTAIFQVKLQKQEIYKESIYFTHFLHLLLRPLLMPQFKNKRYRTLEF